MRNVLVGSCLTKESVECIVHHSKGSVTGSYRNQIAELMNRKLPRHHTIRLDAIDRGRFEANLGIRLGVAMGRVGAGFRSTRTRPTVQQPA
ncbi:hypothetical protein Ahy_A03g012367 isoform L [Arachis hypogaea]|uniref:Uncharacterized protein n=1 Tax=Arachis hypogaea TaxID=3818 RepID=A0A445DT77_ARAHY|nr:hypothetical protein Ahy_A03g012367 isoform L [Arachis hypogaea]